MLYLVLAASLFGVVIILGAWLYFSRPDPGPAKSRPAAPKAERQVAKGDAKRDTESVARSEAKAEPKSAPTPDAAAKQAGFELPSLADASDDDDMTMVTLGAPPGLPQLGGSDEPGDDEAPEQEDSAIPIVYDDEASLDEPTHPKPLIIVSGAAQSDVGIRRKKNEDCYLLLDSHFVFAVADGMGGYAGGEIASQICVETLERAFRADRFRGEPHPKVPRRGSELVRAIQESNQAIYKEARAQRHLEGMGTTLVAARFSPNKQRLYVGHVGDSRCYRLRDDELKQMTTDHTMGELGVTGPLASRLSRAVGTRPGVKVDLVIAHPQPGDLYLLCSDGLNKMVTDDQVWETLLEETTIPAALDRLIKLANAAGGKDNITVVLLKVERPT